MVKERQIQRAERMSKHASHHTSLQVDNSYSGKVRSLLCSYTTF